MIKLDRYMSFTRPFLLGPVFFRTALPFSGGYHLERGGIPLHDAVGTNCEKGSSTAAAVATVAAAAATIAAATVANISCSRCCSSSCNF